MTPEPWTDVDSVAWAKVQAWDLGSNLSSEIFRYLADARLGDPAKTDELFPPYPDGAPVITPSGLAGSGGAGADRPPVSAVESTLATAPSTPPTPAAGVGLAGPRPRRARAPGRRRDRRRSWSPRDARHRLERLGGEPRALADARRAPRQRPASGRLDAVDLDHERAPLPGRGGGLSLRRGRRQLPGGAGRRPRAQRPGRLGRDQHLRRRPGPRDRDRRPGRPGART